MKILFISLLRAGDFIMQVPLIRSAGIRQQVHILVNDEFHQLAELYPEFCFHFFPREHLQALINNQSASLFEPFLSLQKSMKVLNSFNFDTIINLTHNRISAYLMDLLKAPVKKGLTFSEDSLLPMTNSWQLMFNKTFSENQRSQYHYITSLAKSLDLEVPNVSASSDRAQKKRVYLQAFTSDEKKNWSLHNWSQLHSRLQKARPDLEFYFLASQMEVKKLRDLINSQWILECRLTEAREKLSEAAFFITCDTSLAHLAAEVQTPMAVISLGSSDYTKTMPWLHGTWVISSDVGCSPCKHSLACQQESHVCADSLRISTVLQVVIQAMSNRFEMSVAYPERVFRMQMKMNLGLVPIESSLTRRIGGVAEANTHIL